MHNNIYYIAHNTPTYNVVRPGRPAHPFDTIFPQSGLAHKCGNYW